MTCPYSPGAKHRRTAAGPAEDANGDPNSKQAAPEDGFARTADALAPTNDHLLVVWQLAALANSKSYPEQRIDHH
jgi:hypothetical protein